MKSYIAAGVVLALSAIAAMTFLGSGGLATATDVTPSRTVTRTVTTTVTPETTPTVGFEGCTPGYWKQEQHFDSWTPTGYSTGQSVASVFDGESSAFSGVSLLDALSLPGGRGVEGGERILLRAAVAALLNSAQPDVDYPATTGDVIDAVNAALASDDRDTMLSLASRLDRANNLGCPLN